MSFADADLIARVLLNDDQNAFSELVRRHQSPVRGFLIKMANGDAHLADDLAQETFIRAWQRLDTFRSEAKFSTWLFGIAYNQWRMHARSRKELALAGLETPPPEAESPATAPTVA
ncbi:MAG: sigma-70 family RNA polymerase sigma factor [Verrucomicrobia bacterium]|nr:sigma-70 family RNA polymerase sigma factor [Verrucomicrobiota bacterium]